MKLNSFRREYKFATLDEQQIPEEPFQLFNSWMKDAISSGIKDSNAMSVSTIGIDGYPQSRIVLLKDFSENGFVFFTNYESEKGIALKSIPSVSLLFFWSEMERQIRITGKAFKTSTEISDHYFQSRPLQSQAAAIASFQSKRINSRNELESKYHALISNLPEKNFTRPETWGGFVVKPVKIEFWQGRENRLHDRILYEITDNNKWQITRLSP